MKSNFALVRLLGRVAGVLGLMLAVVSCEDDIGPESVSTDMGANVSNVPNYGENNFGIVPGTVAISSDYSSDVQFRTINGRAPYTWQVTRSDLGAINGSGLYSSMTKAGVNNVIVTDSEGVSVQATVTQSAGVSPIPALSIFPTAMTIPTDRQVEIAFQVNGGVAPYTWSVSDSFYGTVTQTGQYTSNEGRAGINYVSVRDRDGKTATATVTATN